MEIKTGLVPKVKALKVQRRTLVASVPIEDALVVGAVDVNSLDVWVVELSTPEHTMKAPRNTIVKVLYSNTEPRVARKQATLNLVKEARSSWDHMQSLFRKREGIADDALVEVTDGFLTDDQRRVYTWYELVM